jgi:hypothetical protein
VLPLGLDIYQRFLKRKLISEWASTNTRRASDGLRCHRYFNRLLYLASLSIARKNKTVIHTGGDYMQPVDKEEVS